MLITFELPEDIAKELETRWTELPRAALESLALEEYRSNALSTAQLCRLLGFETRMQMDEFLREHEVYDFTVTDFKQDCETLRQARELSIESAPVRSSWPSKRHPVDRPSSADHWPVIGFCRARQSIWVGDWSGRPSNLRVHKSVVQGALAQRLNDLRAFDSILAGSNLMSGSSGRYAGGPCRSRHGFERRT